MQKMLLKIKMSLLFLFLIFAFNAYGEVPTHLPSNIPPKETSPSKITPVSPLIQKASDLSIEKVYLKDCRIYVVLKNIGSGGVTDEDYQSGELMVLVKKGERDFEKNSFKLKDVDPKFILKTPAQQIEFDTKIKCSEQMQVKVLLSGLKADSKKGKKEYAATLVPLKFCLEEGIRKIVPATGPGSSPKVLESDKVLKSEQQDKREFMMKPPESTVPKIAPSTEIIKSKEMIKAKSEELKERPEMKKAETIFHEQEKMRGCPQPGKVYYYTVHTKYLNDYLYIWEQGQSKESSKNFNVECYGWLLRERLPEHEPFCISRNRNCLIDLISIDDGVECRVSPIDGNIYGCTDKYGQERNDYFLSTEPSGKRFYVKLNIFDVFEKDDGTRIHTHKITYTSGPFTLINYDIEAKKYEFGQAESPVPSNPFKMELTYKDINLMTPQVIYLKDEGEKGYHYVTLRDVTLKLKTKDGSAIRNNKCVKNWIDGNEYQLKLVAELIGIDKEGNLDGFYWETTLSPRELRYTIEKDTLTIPSLKVAITLPSNYYQIELRPKIKVCEKLQYEFQPLAKIIIYESSKDNVKPYDINIKGFRAFLYGGQLFVKYLTPDVYYLIFNLSPPIHKNNPRMFHLYYQNPENGQWVVLKEYERIVPTNGDFIIEFSLENLKKIYFGNKVNLKLEWLAPYSDYYGNVGRICVKEISFPFKNIVIFHPKIGDKLYLNHPFLIQWGSTDKSGDVIIRCNPGSKLIARVQDKGEYRWIPTSEFINCNEIKIEKIGKGVAVGEPPIKNSSQFYGVYQVGIKIVSPLRDNLLSPGPIPIIWELNAPENERNGKIKLYYRINKRIENRNVYGDWQLIADNISVNENTWMWEVPNITETNKWCEIKIVWEKYIGDQRVSYEDIISFSIKPL